MDFSDIVSEIEALVMIINPTLDIAVTTILIFLLGFILGKILGKLINWALKQVNTDHFIKRYLRINIPFQKIFSSTVTYTIYIITVYVGLNRLHVIGYIFYIIAGAVFIFALMSVLTTIKDFFPNAAAGIYLKRRRFFKVDDEITVSGIKGKVISEGLLSTQILTKDNEHIILPNSAIKNAVFKVKRN